MATQRVKDMDPGLLAPAKKTTPVAPANPNRSNVRETRTPVQGARQTQANNIPAVPVTPVSTTPSTPAPVAPSTPAVASTPSLTAPTEPVDHSTESGTNAINAILNGLIGFSPAEIANFYNEYKSGLPLSRIVDDIRSSQPYATRFPGMAALVKTGNRISEKDYIDKENADRDIIHTYLGPAASQYDSTAQLGALISGHVATTELQGRLQAYNDAVLQAPAETVQWLKDQGLTQGDLISYWINPDIALTDIQRRANMGQLGGAAQGAGVGIDAATANQLAAQGTTVDQARAGFGKIGLDGQLETNLPGDTTGSVTQQDLINATFNNDAVAQQKINRVQQGRTAIFQEGGQYATDSKGVSGLGVAATQ